MAFTVACAQIAPEKAQVEANLDKIADLIVQASAEGADLVVFPEASTTGYFLEGGVVESAIGSSDLLAGICRRLEHKLDRPVDALVGFYQSEKGSLYNAAGYLQLGNQENKV